MTDTRARRDSVDFSLTYFVRGTVLVKKGSDPRHPGHLAGASPPAGIDEREIIRDASRPQSSASSGPARLPGARAGQVQPIPTTASSSRLEGESAEARGMGDCRRLYSYERSDGDAETSPTSAPSSTTAS